MQEQPKEGIDGFEIEEIRKHVAELSDDKAKIWEKMALVLLARQCDDADGYAAFYELIFGHKLLPYAHEWVERAYEAWEQGMGLLVRAFRGSTKTYTLNIGLTAWQVGKHPETASLLIQAGDDLATKNSNQIADIISTNPMWKAVFPNFAVDELKGWGAKGYEIKRTDVDYAEWRAMNASRKDPSFLGVGYKSKIIGMHPGGLLILDDILDEGNTSSWRELATVNKIVTGTIFPARTDKTRLIVVGTPWVENDLYDYLEDTGQFVLCNTPAEWEEEGKKNYAWEEKFNEKRLEIERRLAGSTEYKRMFLLDLKSREDRVFKYQDYPCEAINPGWALWGGVDYAGVEGNKDSRLGKTDFFAMAHIAKLPTGGAVIVGGTLHRGTQAEAEVLVTRAQEIHPNWHYTVIEGDTVGEQFIQVVKRNPGLRIIPMKTQGRAKSLRLEKDMGPWMENGTLRISNESTPFLDELRKEMDTYPANAHDDALDAVYWACRAIPEVFQIARVDTGLPEVFVPKKLANPFVKAIARA